MNRENLQTLATFLAYAEVDGVEFDMATYSEWGNETGSLHCGTVGCAVGWATMLWPKPVCLAYEPWAGKMFMSARSPRFMWCFGANWCRNDNTRLGAAKRIQYLLDHNGKLPKWDYDKQTVALYQSTEVKREHPHTEIVCPVQEAPLSRNEVRKESHSLIADLIKKIEREPRRIQLERTSK